MNQFIRSIIIDDEENNILLLKKMLEKHCTDVKILATETDAEEGIKLIGDLKPELVFLDIQMPELSGLQLLKRMEPISFEVIFVTAHSSFALEAFENNVLGYVTKPILADKLIIAVKNASTRILQKTGAANLFSFLESRMQKPEEEKIPLSTMNGILFVSRDEIVYCESHGNYTYFHLADGRKITVSRQLGEYEKLFDANHFVRIHDRYLIHLKFVNEYLKGRVGDIKLSNGITLPVSENRKEHFLARFEKWLKR